MTENTWPTGEQPGRQPQPPRGRPTTKRRRWPWVIGVVGALMGGLTIGAAAASDPDIQAETIADDHPAVLERITELDDVEADLDDRRGELDSLQRELNECESALDEQESALDEQASELDEQTSDIAAREEDLDSREDDLGSRESELDERANEIAGQEESIEENTIPGDGVFVVEDIEAGTYRTDGGPLCYWARLSDTSGDFDALITNGLPEGPATVTIQDSDGAFESSGCPDWTLR